MLRRLVFPIAIAMILASCAAEPTAPSDPVDDTYAAIDPSLDPASSDDAAEASTEQASIASDASAAGCAVVTTCNAPGADGTRCRQQPGCSLGAARLECELEAFQVCGAAICPVILIHTDGARENLCGGDRP